MLAIDNIKIKYSQEGYLPDYPPHLISDEEMCEAFIPSKYALDTAMYEDKQAEAAGHLGVALNSIFSYFNDVYPLINKNLEPKYNILINSIKYHIVRLITKVPLFRQNLPDWVYSYMLGQVVNHTSSQQDRHYLLVGIGLDNIDDVLTSDVEAYIYNISKRWFNKLDNSIKYANIYDILNQVDSEYNPIFSNSDKEIIWAEFEHWGVTFDEGSIITRPPSMFGEQSIIKLIRLGDVNSPVTRYMDIDQTVKELCDKYNLEYELDYHIEISESLNYTFAFYFRNYDILLDIDYWYNGNNKRHQIRSACVPEGLTLIVIHEETLDSDLSSFIRYMLKLM